MAAAPARLAERSEGDAWWRETPDGSLEVATLSDGAIERWIVRADGTTRLTNIVPAPARRDDAPRLLWTGVAMFALGLIGLVTGVLTSTLGFFVILPGLGVAALGVLLVVDRTNVPGRLRELPDGGGEWHVASKLSGWAPQTSEQFAAVEQLANDNGGVAHLVDSGQKTVEVLVAKRGHTRHYTVDVTGDSRQTAAEGSTGGWVGRIVFFPLIVALTLGALSHHGSTRHVLIVCVIAATALAFAIEAFMPRAPPARNGRAWREIRTREEDHG